MRAMSWSQRWWIRPPMPDESLRSVLSRAAALYERHPQHIWDSLNEDDPEPAGDVESPSCAALNRMATAIGTAPSTLFAHRLPDAPWLLATKARTIYCPICWSQYLARGEPCAIRRNWCRLLHTRCPDHCCPLRLAPEQWATRTRPPVLELPNFTGLERRILDLIESFGAILEDSLYHGAAWPSYLKGDPQTARLLLLAVSFNLNQVRDCPLTKCVYTTGNLENFVRGPLQRQEPVTELRWKSFREIADPAIRRAGLWATGWELMRERPRELSPGWSKLPQHIEAKVRLP